MRNHTSHSKFLACISILLLGIVLSHNVTAAELCFKTCAAPEWQGTSRCIGKPATTCAAPCTITCADPSVSNAPQCIGQLPTACAMTGQLKGSAPTPPPTITARAHTCPSGFVMPKVSAESSTYSCVASTGTNKGAVVKALLAACPAGSVEIPGSESCATCTSGYKFNIITSKCQ